MSGSAVLETKAMTARPISLGFQCASITTIYIIFFVDIITVSLGDFMSIYLWGQFQP